MTNPKPSRTRWKIALGVVVLFAVVGWLVAWPAYLRHRAVQEIERVGGEIAWEKVGPDWLIRLGMGSDRGHTLYLGHTTIADDGLILLRGLPHLFELNLHNTGITNDGLLHLSQLPNLGMLQLSDTRVGNDGLKHLGRLTRLRVLNLDRTHVSDDGLKHLSGLTNLEWLSLDGTDVTEDGVKTLQESLPDCEIER